MSSFERLISPSRLSQVNLTTFFSCLFSSLLSCACLCPTLTLQYKSVFRSYSQDFVPHSQASVQPFLPSTSSSSPHFPPVHQSQSSDLAVPPVASLPPSTLDGLLSSSQESSFHGNTVCLPSETSFTDSPQTPSVRTQHARLHTGLPAPRKPPPVLALEAIAGVGLVMVWLG